MTLDGLLQVIANSGWQRRLAVGVSLAMASVIGLAQQVGNPANLAPQEEVEKIRRYAVELIVFEYNDSGATDTELFAPDAVTVEDELLMEFPLQEPADEDQINASMPQVNDAQTEDEEEVLPSPFSGEELILNEISTPEQTGLKVLDPSAYVLDKIYDKLVALDAYTPLMRTAWIQETLEKDLTTPIKLRRLGNSPLRLNGTVTLYLSRYLHLVVDLALDEKTARPDPYDSAPDSAPSYGDNRGQSDYAFGYEQDPQSAPIHYRIVEDRIVRNGELRYYDHPKFGVLAKITRVEEIAQKIESAGLPVDSIGN